MRVLDPESRELLLELHEARGVFGRMRGLIGRSSLDPGSGLALRSKQVHTFGMQIPIDAVYISRRGNVLKTATLGPGSVGPFVPRARWVLELGSGEARRLGILEGKRVLLERSR